MSLKHHSQEHFEANARRAESPVNDGPTATKSKYSAARLSGLRRSAADRVTDLTGKDFGQLHVVGRAKTPGKSTKAYWHCLCHGCGRKFVVRGQHLTHGQSACKSCARIKNQIIDLAGKRYGKLLVLRHARRKSKTPGQAKREKRYCQEARWVCKCDCGRAKTVVSSDLRDGHTTSCGCNRTPAINIVGKRFGLLVVLCRGKKVSRSTNRTHAGPKPDPANGKKVVFWKCQCDCGRKVFVRGAALRSGRTRSCGCEKRRAASGCYVDLALSVSDRVTNDTNGHTPAPTPAAAETEVATDINGQSERKHPAAEKHRIWKTWKENGLSYQQVANKWEAATGEPTERGAVKQALRRLQKPNG